MTQVPTLEKIDSQSELKERIRQSPESLLLGDDAESPRMFCRFTPNSDGNTAIGIVSGEAETMPQFLAYPGCYIFGFDQQVVKVVLEPLRRQSSLDLDGVFFEFIELSSRILVFHELGVVCIDPSLNILWLINTDVLVSWKIVGDWLHLEEQDSASILKVNLENGLMTS